MNFVFRFRAPRSELLVFWVPFKLCRPLCVYVFSIRKEGIKKTQYLIFKILNEAILRMCFKTKNLLQKRNYVLVDGQLYKYICTDLAYMHIYGRVMTFETSE